MKIPRWVGLGGVVVLLLAAADGAAWLWAQRALARSLADWTAGAAADGVQLERGAATRGGWPFTAAATLSRPVLRAGGLTLRCDRAVLSLSPLRPATLRIGFPDPVTVTAGGGGPVTLASPDWTIDVALNAPWSATMQASTLAIVGLLPTAAAGTVVASTMSARVQPTGDALDVTLRASDISLPPPPPGTVWPIGRAVAAAGLDAAVTQVAALGRLDAEGAARWRDGGGEIPIRAASLRYGPLDARASGWVSLDRGLQPVGHGVLRLGNVEASLDAMTGARAITQAAARTIGTVLRLVSTKPADRSAGEEDVPLAIGDGAVSVAGFPVARMPVLAWATGGS